MIDSTIPRKKGSSMAGYDPSDLMPGEKKKRQPQSVEYMRMVAEMFAAAGVGTITIGKN